MNKKTKKILFSIVVITHERPVEIIKCIKSILSAGVNFRDVTEIIVIDSSNKNTVKYPNGIIITRRPDIKDAASKRNIGAQKSKAQWVAFVDDDCTVPNYFFKQIAKTIKSSDKQTGGWYAVTSFKGKKQYALRAIEKSSFTEAFRMAKKSKTLIWGPTSIAIFRKKALTSIGGFREDFSTKSGGEDVDLGVRLTKSGWILRTIPKTLVFHDTATWNTIGQNVQRFIKYGRSDIDLTRHHPSDTILKFNSGLVLLTSFFIILFWGPINISYLLLRSIVYILATTITFALYFSIALRIRFSYALLLVLYDRAYEFGTFSESIKQRSLKSLFFRFAYQEKPVLLGRSKWIYPREIGDILGMTIAFFIVLYIIPTINN